MLKKLVLFVAAVMLLASSAQAALNIIEMRGTPTVITAGSVGQSGTVTLGISDGTAFKKGDSIRFDLPTGVTVDKAVDYYIWVNNTGAQNNISGGALQGDFTASGLVMHVTAGVGATSAYLHFVNGTLTGSAVSPKTGVITLFSGDNTANTAKVLVVKPTDGGHFNGTSGNFENANNAAKDPVTVLPEETILCVNVSKEYLAGSSGAKYVTITPKMPTPYSFDPTSMTVAEVKPKSLSLVQLKGERTLVVGEGQGANCVVDYETATFCEGPWGAGLMGYVAVQNGVSYDEGHYTVTAEILVDGATGKKGAYFGGHVSGLQFVDSQAALSSGHAADITLNLEKAYLAGDKSTTKFALSCAPAEDAKVVKVVSKATAPVTTALASKMFMRIEIPSIALVKDELPKNAKIGVKLTVSKGCNTVAEVEQKNLFTVVEACSTAKKAAGTLLFPYFADAPFWNGMALTNTGDTPVNASLAVVDEKGGKGSIDIMVPANGMYVNLVEKIVADSAFNGTVNKALRCYITVTPQSGRLVGFAMMGNAGESMGYTVNN